MKETSGLKKVLLFEGFTDAELAAVAQQVIEKEAIAGDSIYDEGSQADSMIFIRSGMVEIVARGDGGEDQVITQIGTHGVIGEAAFVDNQPRGAGARAKENTLYWEVSFASLHRLIDHQPVLGAKFYRNLATVIARRIRTTTHSLSSLKELKLRH
jgi:CRP-like cAMP-binding protein